MNRIRLVVRNDKPMAHEIAGRFEALLADRGVTADAGDPGAVVAVGGDGTMLEAASVAIELDIPVCGINVGRVGYLAEFAESEI